MKTAVRMSGIVLICLLPLTAFAQAPPVGSNVSPTPGNVQSLPNHFPHPVNPWSGLPYSGRGNYGSVVRYIEVPPQQVQIQVYVPGPGSFSGGYEQQVVEIPAYIITETALGYIYPERVGLQQVTAGVYQWVRLPQQFQPK